MNIALFNDGDIASASPQLSVSHELLAGRYTLDNILGIGGMGVVYRGVDTMLQAFGASSHYIAVKITNAEFSENSNAEKSLFTEYEIASRLKHPNLVAIRHFDICSSRQKAFLVMDWIEGLLLEELLYRQTIPVNVALDLARQLVDAVRYCHAQGVVHGDIKPANIIISPESHLTLFDFGISRWLYQPSGRHREVIRACSCRYAAPELFDEHIPTIVTDVFSTCCVIYRLFSGEHPFKDTTDEAAARQDIIKPIVGRRHPLNKALQQGLKWSHQDRSCNLDVLHKVLNQLTASDFSNNWF
jgi:serine/threonine-protein kinase Stk1